MTAPGILRSAAAEAIGTGFLTAGVVGSGIMGDRLSGGSPGLALLANTVATAAALTVLILALGPVCGAHFNPLVTADAAVAGRLRLRRAAAYVAAQFAGAAAGVLVAHAMFDLPLVQVSATARDGRPLIFSEAVAAFGLLLVIAGVSASRPAAIAPAVGLYIASAYWFTASTSFANPAVTAARALTDTFAGIRPSSVPGFLLGQCVGAVCASAVARRLFPAPDHDDFSKGGPTPTRGA
jgi:glycerol uptake facilitator-like aquaporin